MLMASAPIVTTAPPPITAPSSLTLFALVVLIVDTSLLGRLPTRPCGAANRESAGGIH
jgi:hypothetical protein